MKLAYKSIVMSALITIPTLIPVSALWFMLFFLRFYNNPTLIFIFIFFFQFRLIFFVKLNLTVSIKFRFNANFFINLAIILGLSLFLFLNPERKIQISWMKVMFFWLLEFFHELH